MRLLLRILRRDEPGPATSRARDLAEKYLPRVEPAFRPFWDALDQDEGDWS